MGHGPLSKGRGRGAAPGLREHALRTGEARPAATAGPHGADERRSDRSSVLLAATIECDGARLAVRVVNLSAHGALVQGDAVPGQDEAVTFRCSGLEVAGWMAWVKPPFAGINFDAPVHLPAIVQGAGTAAMVTRDTRRRDFRRPGFRGDQMSAEEREIVEQWTREQEALDGD
jgi:hypothetical protein